jgi:uncharacterized membrane protein YfbV (UPF0208 family)
MVATTCLFALLLNLSGLWVLGVFSPVTYSVVGLWKDCCCAGGRHTGVS